MTAKKISHTRIPIFNYNKISTFLIPQTKSLEIILNEMYFTQEMIFELETILAWTASHHEIQSIIITSSHAEFIQGIDINDLKNFTPEKCNKFLMKISLISEALLCLPQTVIVDLKNGASSAGLEFALAADIRISNTTAKYQFNYLSQGLVPSAGLFSFLRRFLNQNILRSLLLTGKEFNNNELNSLGGAVEIDASVDELLFNISKQSPISRIQTKLGLQDNQKDIQEKILNSVLFTEDYKQENNFMNTSTYKEKLKEIN
jgi:enoyl-CoA hydratase/carnithine racemase